MITKSQHPKFQENLECSVGKILISLALPSFIPHTVPFYETSKAGFPTIALTSIFQFPSSIVHHWFTDFSEKPVQNFRSDLLLNSIFTLLIYKKYIFSEFLRWNSGFSLITDVYLGSIMYFYFFKFIYIDKIIFWPNFDGVAPRFRL